MCTLKLVAYGKEYDSAILKGFTLWISVQTNMLEFLGERFVAGAEFPHVPCFFVADEGFDLNLLAPEIFFLILTHPVNKI